MFSVNIKKMRTRKRACLFVRLCVCGTDLARDEAEGRREGGREERSRKGRMEGGRRGEGEEKEERRISIFGAIVDSRIAVGIKTE